MPPALPFIAAATGIAGVGMSIKGARDAKKAQESAQSANLAESQRVEQANMERYMMSRGVGPNGQSVNAFLPHYAMVSRPFGQPAGQRRFRKIASPQTTF